MLMTFGFNIFILLIEHLLVFEGALVSIVDYLCSNEDIFSCK